MILDSLLQLSDAQAFTQSDEVTENTVDIGTVERHIGTGEPLALLFNITTAIAGDASTDAGSADFRAIDSAAAALTSAQVLAQVNVPSSRLTAGSKVVVPIPKGAVRQRYLGGQVVLGANDTISADCFVVPQSFIDERHAYPTNIVID